MESYEAYLYRRLAEGLLLFERPHLHEIYVVSLYIDFDAGPHHMKVWLYYNTRSHLQSVIEQGEEPEEARWNFALWEQDYITAVGLTAEECQNLADEQSRFLLAAWLKEQGLYRTDREIEAMLQSGDPDLYIDWDEQVRERLLDLVVGVARQLQETGVVLAKFGRSIPLLVHEWDYNPWTLEATRCANPEGLAAAFEEWLLGEGRCR
ncbi:MAG: hypothetical protein ACOY94_17730 [Bacillota bacterium]